MAKLTWGTPGERYYEAGVDRGAVYIDGVGIAWSGLTAVSEKSPGGDVSEFFLDGIKYAQLMSAEDFEATVEALGYPREFAQCDGTLEVHNGLFATQQRRKTFNMTYRTKVGNDVSGIDLGYKIHLVYNALASPTDRSNQTLTDAAAPMTFSWNMTTVPSQVSGIRPTAHFVVDSRTANAGVLATLENLLYGTNVAAPNFPTASALVAMFA